MKLRNLLVAALLSVAATAMGQTLLGGAEFSHKFVFGLNMGAGLEYRTADWLKHTDQWSAEISASYKPLKPLKVGVSYKFIQAQTLRGAELPAYWANKHRVSLGVTGEWKPVKLLTLSLRERYQYTYRPEFSVPYLEELDGNKTISAKSKHILRSRLMAEWKPKKKCRFTPYISYELYSLLADVNHTKDRRDPAKFYDKGRLTVGSDFKIDRHNSLDLFYRWANTADADEMDSPHTIGLIYSFKL